jgi:hypothetical protein
MGVNDDPVGDGQVLRVGVSLAGGEAVARVFAGQGQRVQHHVQRRRMHGARDVFACSAACSQGSRVRLVCRRDERFGPVADGPR